MSTLRNVLLDVYSVIVVTVVWNNWCGVFKEGSSGNGSVVVKTRDFDKKSLNGDPKLVLELAL